MLKGKDNSSFGWDEHMQMVVVEDVVWNSHINRATGKDAQTTIDIVEEIDAEGVATAKNPKELSNDHRCEANVSLDKMHILAIQAQLSKSNQYDSTFSKKKKKISDVSEQISSTSLIGATTLLGENIRTIGLELSRSIASEVLIEEKSKMLIQENVKKVFLTLCEVEGLTKDKCFLALSKIPDYPTQMLIFLNLPSSVRLE
ncbi:hypothetical protein Gohar_013438 [Gossypium harknessii]|uniref:Myb/SANT-like domain-containing protein n=1 Tax=Gossypium harknessii TaxID=34285 RepID=A0A7J9H009_9ROSI|nr:hypothetical protein [Gossypium harknessii]